MSLDVLSEARGKSFSNRMIASWISTSVFCHFMRMLHDVFTVGSTSPLRSSVTTWTQIFLNTAPCGRDKKRNRIQKCFRIQTIQALCGQGLSVTFVSITPRRLRFQNTPTTTSGSREIARHNCVFCHCLNLDNMDPL